MKFLHCFSTLVTLSMGVWSVVSSEGNIDSMEIVYLASNLSPVECLRLLQDMYQKRPLSDEVFSRPDTKMLINGEPTARRQLLPMPFFNRDNCRDKLDEWSRNLPQGSNKWARVALEMELRSLGRHDLAKYVRRNRRLVRYFNEMSRISRNTAKHPTQNPQIVAKNNHRAASKYIVKSSPKEAAIQFYQKFGEAKPASYHSDVSTSNGVPERPSSNTDTTTKWTAFLIMVGIIILTILATVMFALYKRNRIGNRVCNTEEKCTSDRCPLADDSRHGRVQPSCCVRDPELDHVTGSSRRGGRRRDAPSRSPRPSITFCVRPDVATDKTRAQKCFKTQARTPEKSSKRGCSEKCAGLKHENYTTERCVKIDPSTRRKDRKNLDKCNQATDDQPSRALKKIQEKIVGILRRENPAVCKCCKCSAIPENTRNGSKCLPGKKRNNVCGDATCTETKLKNIAEFCLTPDETSPSEENKVHREKRKKIKQQQKRKKKRKGTRKDKNGDDDTDKEKESEKSSPENSARSKDKNKQSRVRKKPTKARKEKYNVVEACTRKTCGLRPANLEETANFD